MSDIDLPGLIVPVEARIDRLEKSLAKANGAHRRFSTDIERRSKQSADRMARSYDEAGTSAASAFKKIAVPFAAGFAVASLTEGVKGFAKALPQVVRGMAEVGDSAKRAGLSAREFQEWGFVAEQNRIAVDSLVDGFKELSLRADEFIATGQGSAAEAFKRIGISASDLKQKLKDPSALLLEIFGRLQKLEKAAQIRIADEIFGGTGGERFVALIEQGEDGLRKTIARAHEVGAVMDDAMIAKATELDRKFGELQTRLQSMWRNGAVEAGLYFGLIERERAKLTFDKDLTKRVVGEDVANSLADLPEVPQDALAQIESMKLEYADLAEEARLLVPALSDASLIMRGLGNDASAASLTELSTKIGDAARAFDDGTISGEEYAQKLKDVLNEAQNAIAEMSALDQAKLGGVIGQVSALLEWIGKLPGAASAARAEINALARMDTGTPLTGSGVELLPPPPGALLSSPRPKPAPNDIDFGVPDGPKSAGGAGAGRKLDQYGQATASIRQEIAALEAEALALVAVAGAGKDYGDAIEFARKKADLMVTAQREGREMTPALVAEIDNLAGAYVTAGLKAEDAAAKLKKIQSAGEGAAKTLAGVFTSVLSGATTAGDALQGLLAKMLEVQLQEQLTSLFAGAKSGGFLSFVGGLLGFSGGGYTGDGGTHEPAGVVHKGEFVFSKRSVERIGAVNLGRLHGEALRGYSGGGMVGLPEALQSASGGLPMASGGMSQPITINAPVTVNGSAGTPAQNDDLARKMAKEMDSIMRGVVQDEMRKQLRPGNMMNKGRW